MRLSILPILPLVFHAASTTANVTPAGARVASVYVQPVQQSAAAPSLLAQVEYSLSSKPTSEMVAYEAPDIPDEVSLLRIGLYDPSSATWVSSVAVTSVDNFAKGYSPHIMLALDVNGNVVGVSCQGVGIDAAQTRDFGPQVLLLLPQNGKQPSLNKPVVLSREGKKVVEEEKSFFQK